MKLALRLAAKGRGHTSPNPMVGAVVVSGRRVVGRGYHRHVGGPHAEVHALEQAGPRAKGATLYISLEPCVHVKKRTPPCVPSVIRAGIRRVVVAMSDPNPSVRGRGIRALRRAGLRVDVGCLQEEAVRLNESYCHRLRTGRPLVTVKAAMTLDGKIAAAGGESQWITGEAARRDAHRLRAEADAVLVGIGTVLADDPRLTVRLGGRRIPTRTGARPLRVVLDSRLRIPLRARMLRETSGGQVVVMTTPRAPAARIKTIEHQGARVIQVAAARRGVSLHAALRALAGLGVNHVLVEGGAEVNAALLQGKLADRLVLYMAPKLLGGRDALSVIGGSAPRLADAISLDDVTVRRIGSDLRIEARILTPTRSGIVRARLL
jgi:diaminohydroxyphosphoribosylaminopyrimidine deaminase/5-amino-6-(5-phosphoribosylamino)uracil reductase